MVKYSNISMFSQNLRWLAGFQPSTVSKKKYRSIRLYGGPKVGYLLVKAVKVEIWLGKYQLT